MGSRIICGDARDVLQTLPDSSISLVFTDPPYPRKYKHTFQYLADYCPRLMKRGASLVTIAPHYLLEEIMSMFLGKLKYRWILNMSQLDGNHPRMAMGIEVCWKPMLWYVKEAYPSGRGFLRDAIQINGNNGIKKPSGHIWEQDLSWTYYIAKLTKPGDTVLDPYVGSGTTAEACKLLDLNFIGIDNDEASVSMTEERLGETKTPERGK
jgi:DNA modification methylase